jgi:hypothetical protein
MAGAFNGGGNLDGTGFDLHGIGIPWNFEYHET